MTTETRKQDCADLEAPLPKSNESPMKLAHTSNACKIAAIVGGALVLVVISGGIATAVLAPTVLGLAAKPSTAHTSVVVDVKVTVPSVFDCDMHAAVDVPADGTSAKWHLIAKKADGRCSHILRTDGSRYSFTSADCTFAPTDATECTFRNVANPEEMDMDATATDLLSGTNTTAGTIAAGVQPFAAPALCELESDASPSPEGLGEALRSGASATVDLQMMLRTDLVSTAAHTTDLSADAEGIVGGDQIPLFKFWRDYPFLCSLNFHGAPGVPGKYRHWCGGTLIAPQWVLTAAHCLGPDVFTAAHIKDHLEIRLGMYDSTWADWFAPIFTRWGYGASVRSAEDIILHKDYRGNRNDPGLHDLALIKLDSPVRHIGYDRFASIDALDEGAGPGGWSAADPRWMTTVAGWGKMADGTYPTRPEEVDVPVTSCPNLEAGGDICAGAVAGKDSCNGDSGGPLIVRNGNRVTLVGVVSRGPQACGTQGSPGIYTGVAAHRQWISEITNGAVDANVVVDRHGEEMVCPPHYTADGKRGVCQLPFKSRPSDGCREWDSSGRCDPREYTLPRVGVWARDWPNRGWAVPSAQPPTTSGHTVLDTDRRWLTSGVPLNLAGILNIVVDSNGDRMICPPHFKRHWKRGVCQLGYSDRPSDGCGSWDSTRRCDPRRYTLPDGQVWPNRGWAAPSAQPPTTSGHTVIYTTKRWVTNGMPA